MPISGIRIGSGRPLEEALSRAEAYVGAGADGIFIHSKRPMAAEIAPFVAAWQADLPLVIAPTMYGDIHFSMFEQLGIALVL